MACPPLDQCLSKAIGPHLTIGEITLQSPPCIVFACLATKLVQPHHASERKKMWQIGTI
jgi:hypothetical protein